MINIIVFGTGSSAEQFLSTIDKGSVNILAFSDNDPSKHNTPYKQYKVIPPKDITKYEFDYIFVASQFSDEIIPQLIQLGIKSDKVIPSDYARHNYLMRQVHEKANKLVRKNSPLKNEKLKIALLNYNYSNYNGYALYKYMPDYIKEKYDVDLIEEKNKGKLMRYNVICSSLFEGLYEEKYINIELWHGFPIKRIGVMDSLNVNDDFLRYVEKSTKYTNLVLSYSELYTTFFNSSFPSNISKYRITGMPRNDLLFEKGSLDKLEKLTNRKLNDYNIAFYLPTWRKGKNPKRIDADRDWDQLFGFIDEDNESIIKILEDNNLFLVVKLHPYEYNLYKNLSIFQHKNIYLIQEGELEKQKIHLYELLSASSFIITDYSSIFFDTLLLELPIIFAPTDKEEYRKNKGFLIEPYDYLTPGATVTTVKELYNEINKILNGIDLYVREREEVKNIVFKHFDNKSSIRGWQVIDEYLDNKIVNNK